MSAVTPQLSAPIRSVQDYILKQENLRYDKKNLVKDLPLFLKPLGPSITQGMQEIQFDEETEIDVNPEDPENRRDLLYIENRALLETTSNSVLEGEYDQLKQLSERVAAATSELRLMFENNVNKSGPRTAAQSELELNNMTIAIQEKRPHSAGAPIMRQSPKDLKLPASMDKLSLPCNQSASAFYLESLSTNFQHDKLVSKNASTWKSVFMSKIMSDLFIDMFWAVWLRLYKESTKTLHILMTRIGENYVHLLNSLKRKDGELFFQYFPDIMAHSLFLCFNHSFQDSRTDFELPFQKKLCSNVYQILTGSVPSSLPCTKWGCNQDNHTKGTEEESMLHKHNLLSNLLTSRSLIGTPINLNDFLVNSNQTANLNQKVDNFESSIFGNFTRLRQVPFNVYQNSPIVREYLVSRGCANSDNRRIKIKRTQPVEYKKLDNPVTYRQVVMSSIKDSKKRSTDFKNNLERINKERNLITQETMQYLSKENERIMKIMMKPQSIKLATDLILEIQNLNGNNRSRKFVKTTQIE